MIKSMMRNLLIGTALPLVWATYAIAAPTLSVTATDNGTSLVFVPATNVPGDLTGTFLDPLNFSQITVDLTGVPAVASPDFGTVTLQVSGFTGTGTHEIVLDATQSGLTEPAGFNGELTMTNNNLIGGNGPTTQTFSINGAAVNSFTFPASPASSATKNFTDSGLPAITFESQAFDALFTTAGQDLEATQEFKAATVVSVHEPSTLALLGAALLAMFAFSQRKSLRW